MCIFVAHFTFKSFEPCSDLILRLASMDIIWRHFWLSKDGSPGDIINWLSFAPGAAFNWAGKAAGLKTNLTLVDCSKHPAGNFHRSTPTLGAIFATWTSISLGVETWAKDGQPLLEPAGFVWVVFSGGGVSGSVSDDFRFFGMPCPADEFDVCIMLEGPSLDQVSKQLCLCVARIHVLPDSSLSWKRGFVFEKLSLTTISISLLCHRENPFYYN